MSRGVSSTRKAAAVSDAASVCNAMGSVRVASSEPSSASAPALDAVSPKRDSGAWISAGPTPA
jgi:hypothetical protein